ncbi:hypothetical protein FQN55_005382 [Onygenales sp. PD_40]|nr:hypothetical protein FQN55_005382 [Onygenales sp. PD_40]
MADLKAAFFTMTTKPNDERARESFASIYSFYRNLDSADVPDWANDSESGNIIIGFVRHAAPTEEEMAKAKGDLRTLMGLEGTREKLTETEKKLFGAAADGATNTGDRYCSSSDEPTVEGGIAERRRSCVELRDIHHQFHRLCGLPGCRSRVK